MVYILESLNLRSNMAVRFSTEISVHTLSEDGGAKTTSQEGTFFLTSRLENLTHLLKLLNELNCQETTYHQFYTHIHPRICSMLDFETPVKEFETSIASSKLIQLAILEKIDKLREKNWELCAHFDTKYQQISPKSRQRLMTVKSFGDPTIED
jgi:hypothetical protein